MFKKNTQIRKKTKKIKILNSLVKWKRDMNMQFTKEIAHFN